MSESVVRREVKSGESPFLDGHHNGLLVFQVNQEGARVKVPPSYLPPGGVIIRPSLPTPQFLGHVPVRLCDK